MEHKLALAPEVLRRMLNVLRHRGPDDEGLCVHSSAGCCFMDSGGASAGHVSRWCSSAPTQKHDEPSGQLRSALPGVALGHRRLAIIDRAGGRQPMWNEDGTVWLVCNGQIFNYRRLRGQLEAAGHRFRTRSDVETIVHLYEDHGYDFLAHLVGMFALALWDARSRHLLLARDRLGQKPLVYFCQPGRLIFASQLKALLEVPGLPRRIDPGAIDAYLTYQYVPHPLSIFEGYGKLLPGQVAIWRDDRLELRQYWSPLPDEREPCRPTGQGNLNWPPGAEPPTPDATPNYAAQLRAMLTEAVRSQLESEVPLGVFLSGGVDSTIMVGLMRRLGVEPLRTFTISFPQREYDESPYARAVAAQFSTEHHEFRWQPSAVELLPQLAWHYDEPFADSSALPTWQLAQMARKHVTVALSGDGGDELFAGYQRYAAVRLACWLRPVPAALRTAAATCWRHVLPAGAQTRSWWRRMSRFLAALDLPADKQYLEWVSVFDRHARRQLYTAEFAASVADRDPGQFICSAWERFCGCDALAAAALTDLLTYLPCDLMTKVDTATMAHGLECRQPFLDHRVVELAAAMPVALKWRMGRGKRILKAAFADLLPPAVRRRRKMGFALPLDHCFRGDLAVLARDLLLDRRSTQRGYFRPQAVAQLLESHQQQRAEHSHRLWTLLMLELWHRQWADGNP